MKKNFICVDISDSLNHFWLSCVYGHHNLQKWHKVWFDFIQFASTIGEHDEWLTIGDFNQILFAKDKVSFKNSLVRGAEGLIDCLNSCKLSEIPPKGQFLTWTNNRVGDELVWERLDRSFANNSWLRNHDSASLTNFLIIHSNHGAMLLTTHKETRFRKRPYRFEKPFSAVEIRKAAFPNWTSQISKNWLQTRYLLPKILASYRESYYLCIPSLP